MHFIAAIDVERKRYYSEVYRRESRDSKAQ